MYIFLVLEIEITFVGHLRAFHVVDNFQCYYALWLRYFKLFVVQMPYGTDLFSYVVTAALYIYIHCGVFFYTLTVFLMLVFI